MKLRRHLSTLYADVSDRLQQITCSGIIELFSTYIGQCVKYSTSPQEKCLEYKPPKLYKNSSVNIPWN